MKHQLLSRSFYVVALLLILSTSAMAAGLFNQDVVATHEGSSVTLGNVGVGGKYYQGTWTMDEQGKLNLDISSVAEMNNSSAFNYLEAFRLRKKAVDVDGSDPVLENFRDVSDGCRSYFSYLHSNNQNMYCCQGDNFFRILGQKTDSYTMIFRNFELPSFMQPGSSVAREVQQVISSARGDRTRTWFVQVSVHDDPAQNAWRMFFSFCSAGKFTTKFFVHDKQSLKLLDTKKVGIGPWPE